MSILRFAVRALTKACILPVLLATPGCGGGPTDQGGTSRLAFVTQPDGAVAGVSFARQPVVEVRNGSGQLVTDAIPVTLTLTSNATGATLLGVPVHTTSGGTATFSDIAIDLVGSDYQITASSPNVQSATSTAFVVTGPASSATSEVTVPASLLLVGETVTATLQARDASGTPLTRGGSTVTFTLADGSSGGTFSPTVDNGNGTYTALFTAGTAGTSGLVRSTLDGVEVSTPPSPMAVVAFASISAGQQHTCAVTTDGRSLCWGSNAHGQLGVSTSNSFPPVQVPGTQVWTSIHAGHRNTCGQANDGGTYCWGNNEYSQVGNGTTSLRQNAPAVVSSGLVFQRLHVSLGFTSGSTSLDQGFVNCAVTAAGQAYCWGDGRYGQIGNGSLDEQSVPTPVSGGLTLGSVAAGSLHACGIASTNGRPYCWGVNANGQLGIGNGSGDTECEGLICGTTPVATATPRVFDAASIAVGTDHSCGLSEGFALCWGANRFGALGDGTSTGRNSPTLVYPARAFSALTAGDAMTCGLTPAGEAYCWGRKSGPGIPSAILSPALVGGGHTYLQIDAGGSHACGVIATGAAYCWGANASGQLGSGNLISSFSPVRVRLR